MDRITSLYLDVARFCAAILVVLSHTPAFVGINFGPASSLGSEAVVIFFVLSGYVISYVTEKKERCATAYFRARASRIYSVLIPALLVTFIADYVGTGIDMGFYVDHGNFHNDYSVASIVSILTFTGEVLGRHVVFGSNEPVWSLGFECIYYVIFGVCVFCKRRILSMSISAIVLLIAIPKVAVFFPLWLAGVVIHRIKNEASGLVSLVMFACGLAGIIVIKFLFHGVTPMYRLGFDTPDFIQSVLYFYGIGLSFGVSIIGSGAAIQYIKADALLQKFEKIIRWLSSKTFSIYIIHLPLMMVLVVSIGVDSSIKKAACLLLSIFISFIFSSLFESKKGLSFYLIKKIRLFGKH